MRTFQSRPRTSVLCRSSLLLGRLLRQSSPEEHQKQEGRRAEEGERKRVEARHFSSGEKGALSYKRLLFFFVTLGSVFSEFLMKRERKEKTRMVVLYSSGIFTRDCLVTSSVQRNSK